MTLPTTRLNEMCEFVIDCPHFTPEWTTSGFIVIRNQNIRDGRLDLTDPSFTHKEDFNRRNRRAKPKAGDIIFTREAPMGEVCIVPAGLECCIGQRQVLLRPRSDVDSRYLFYALRSNYVRHQIFWNEGTGSTVSNVRIPVLEALKIPRLGTSEFETASILAALDDKIELNRQMNETLEAMARAIFKDWFVDFGPTRTKMAGFKPYLAPEIWKLFPDSLDDEGKPYGWNYDRLGNITELSWGDTNTTKSSYVKSGYPAYSASGPDGFMSYADFDRKGIVLSAIGANCGQTWFASGKWSCIKNTIRIWSNNRYMSDEYLYLATHGSDFWPKRGSAQPFISQADARNCVVLNPSKEIGIVFGNIIAPNYEKIRENKKENTALSETRDLLLPKLMSGEIRLRYAALTAEAVLEKAG